MGTAVEIEAEPTSLDEAKIILRDLTERHRNQAHQILSWRRRAKAQEELLARLARDHAEQLRGLSSQLLLFEARLCRRQKDIRMLLMARENCIQRQAKTIRALQNRLSEAGLDSSLPDGEEIDPDTPTSVAENDSDSAVVLEDGTTMDLQLVLPLSSVLRYNSANAAVQRSISDATKFSSSGAGGKRGSNSFLRRPEILETVYSVEEDPDADVVENTDDQKPFSDSDKPSEDEDNGDHEEQEQRTIKLKRHPPLRSSRRAVDEEEPPAWISNNTQQVTYNRVMGNNHRSVTKPRDVKYKRINKAKSKSLEELRGKLKKTWVEQRPLSAEKT